MFLVQFPKLYSQTFSEHYFSVSEKCKLVEVLDTYEGNDKLTVYQCVDGSSTNIFRVIVTTFHKKITDSDAYYRQLKSEYSKLGQTDEIRVKGKKAIQTIENIIIEGQKNKQVSVAMLYKGKSITLVLVTKSSNYTALIDRFKNNFTFL